MVKHASRADRADPGMALWLDRLREAHAALIGAIEELARLTAGPPPDRQLLVDSRWAVSQATAATSSAAAIANTLTAGSTSGDGSIHTRTDVAAAPTKATVAARNFGPVHSPWRICGVGSRIGTEHLPQDMPDFAFASLPGTTDAAARFEASATCAKSNFAQTYSDVDSLVHLKL